MCHYTTTCTTAENCTNMGKGNMKKNVQSVAGDMERNSYKLTVTLAF